MPYIRPMGTIPPAPDRVNALVLVDGQALPMPVAMHDAGYTLAEIADACGIGEVAAAGILTAHGRTSLNARHVLRMAHAQLAAAMPGERWREVVDRQGNTHVLRETRPPDSKAAAVMLAAHAPEGYGRDAMPTGPPVVVIDRGALAREERAGSAIDPAPEPVTVAR